MGLQAPHSVTATLQCLPSAHFGHSMPVLALTAEGRGDSWHFTGYWKSDHPCEICHTATNFWKAKWWLYVWLWNCQEFYLFCPPIFWVAVTHPVVWWKLSRHFSLERGWAQNAFNMAFFMWRHSITVHEWTSRTAIGIEKLFGPWGEPQRS